MASSVPFRDVVAYAIGGGWGSDNPTDGAVPVSIIRGTDFANLQSGNASDVPLRYEVNEKAEKRILRPGDVVLEISGGSPTSGQSTGRTLLIKESILADLGSRVIPASFCRLVRFDTAKVDSRYAYYALQDMYLSGRAAEYEHRSTGISNFQFEYFLDQEVIRLVPLPEQRAIAHILGTLDDKIELNRRMNETLEAIARALFKSWFVDFDPVRAKAEGRDPGLPAHLADLFPDSFEDSELGGIPEGWRVAPIGELAVVAGGSTPSTREAAFWEDGRNCWATPKDLSTLATPVLLETERRITDAGLAEIGSGLLPPGTILLSSRAPIGYLAIAEVPLAINQGFIAMRPAAEVSNLFLLYWAEWAQEEIVSRANGSTFLEISKSNFRPIPVVTPGPRIFEAFDEMVRPLHSRIVANERETRTLTSVRDKLLPKLISGDLRTKND